MPSKTIAPASVPTPAQGVLSAEFILEIKHELDRKVVQLEKLPSEIVELRKKYEAALFFAPNGFNPDAVESEAIAATPSLTVVRSRRSKENWPMPTATTPEQKSLNLKPKTSRTRATKTGRPSWRTAVTNTLEKFGKGVSHKELLTAIRLKHDYPVSNGEKGFYNAAAALQKEKLVIKHGGLLYAAKVVATIKKNGGDLPDVPEVLHRRGSSGELVASILRVSETGLTAPQLRQILIKTPNAPKSLQHHGQYIYNVLGTLIGAGEVIKNDGIYRLVAGGK